ncbi:MAG: c-type cytochrome [Pirellulales bacterium]
MASIVLLGGLPGCRPTLAPQFTPNADFVALTEDASDDEDKQLWQGIQRQILDVLAEECGSPTKLILLGDEDMDPAHLKRGGVIYTRYCVQCHGVSGDGAGAVAEYLQPLPRDYRRGIFKFTSTPYGAKPRRHDIMRTLRNGVPGTAMPAFNRMSKEDVEAVTDYVLALTRRGELESQLVAIAEDEEMLDEDLIDEAIDTVLTNWKLTESQLVMPESVMPTMTAETIEAGRQLFVTPTLGCVKCHGNDGRGGFFGELEITKDAWGHKTSAADLTSGMFRGGGRPIDIYRRIHSGINGSPMPGFASTFSESPESVWHLVHFVKDVGERRRRGQPPERFGDAPIPDESDSLEESDDSDEADDEAPADKVETQDGVLINE